MTDPTRIVVAGDWHGNTGWALGVVRRLPALLPDERPRLVLHLGDFGIWPGGDKYLRKLDRELDRADAVLWFVDGNHEDHRKLTRLPLAAGGLGQAGNRIFHLPRGHRWTWHDRTWLALGGAVSLDKSIRTEGKTWWPEEAVTADQATAASTHPADVMVTHDCPASVRHTFPPPPAFWDLADIAHSDQHRERLQGVVDAVRPSHLMHGHLHRSYQRTLDCAWGPLEVTGLDCENTAGNWAVLDVRSMSWGDGHPAAEALVNA